jgi:hypothetical protein
VQRTVDIESFEELLPKEAKNVFVISCGLGIQTIAGLAEIPVYAGSDSVIADGHHGMALTTTFAMHVDSVT